MKVTKLDSPEVDYAVQIERGGIPLRIVRVNKNQLIQVTANLSVSTKDQELFTADKQQAFWTSFLQNVARSNLEWVSPDAFTWILIDRVIDDGFSYDRLYDILKRVFVCASSSLNELNRILGLGQKNPIKVTDDSHLSLYG